MSRNILGLFLLSFTLFDFKLHVTGIWFITVFRCPERSFGPEKKQQNKIHNVVKLQSIIVHLATALQYATWSVM